MDNAQWKIINCERDWQENFFKSSWAERKRKPSNAISSFLCALLCVHPNNHFSLQLQAHSSLVLLLVDAIYLRWTLQRVQTLFSKLLVMPHKLRSRMNTQKTRKIAKRRPRENERRHHCIAAAIHPRHRLVFLSFALASSRNGTQEEEFSHKKRQCHTLIVRARNMKFMLMRRRVKRARSAMQFKVFF